MAIYPRNSGQLRRNNKIYGWQLWDQGNRIEIHRQAETIATAVFKGNSHNDLIKQIENLIDDIGRDKYDIEYFPEVNYPDKDS